MNDNVIDIILFLLLHMIIQLSLCIFTLFYCKIYKFLTFRRFRTVDSAEVIVVVVIVLQGYPSKDTA